MPYPTQRRPSVRLLVGLGAVTFMLVVSFIYHPEILKAYARQFTVSNATVGADIILILSGNPSPRARTAITMLRHGYGKRIMVTQARTMAGEYDAIIQDQAEAVQAIGAHEGVAISTLPSTKAGATSTYDEARDAAAYVRQRHAVRHIIIVTDAFHTARSRYIFHRVFAQGGVQATIEFAPADNDIFDETNWWLTEAGLQSYITEPFKFAAYILR